MMMVLDIKTLMLIFLITNVVSIGAMAGALYQSRSRFAGISFWMAGIIVQVAAIILHVLRGTLPDLVSMTLSKAMIAGAVVIILIGLERFTNKRGPQVQNYILLAIFVALHAYFAVVQPNITVRDIALSAILVIYSFQCCWLLLERVGPDMRRITRLPGIIFAVFAAYNLSWLILTILFPVQSNEYYESGALTSLSITAYIVFSLSLSISLLLMVNMRLLIDVRTQEEKFTTTFRSSPYAITLTKLPDGKIFEVNEGFAKLTGYKPAEVIGKSTPNLRLWAKEEDRLDFINRVSQGQEFDGVEYQFRTRKGNILTGLLSARVVSINNEKCILASIGDITDRKKAEEALARSEEKYRSILEDMQDPYFEVDLKGNFTYVNAATCRNLRYTPEELIGCNFRKTTQGEDEIKSIFKAYNDVFTTGLPHRGYALKVVRKDGTFAYAEVSIWLMKNEQGEPVGFRSVGRDVTEHKQMEDKLLEMATHDALTGLPNRTLLYDRLGIALANAERNNKKVIVMSLDLDGFKDVNDILGHDAGDKLLVVVAERLREVIRKSDTVARMGGDEFVLLLAEVNHKEAAVRVAKKIIKDFRRPFIVDTHNLNITISIGIAIFPDDGRNIVSILQRSDKALYSAKQNGGDRFIM